MKDSKMLSRFRTLVFLVVLVLTVPTRNISAQATDPLIGTWVLNVEKSQYEPGPPPKSAFRTFDYTLDGMILSSNHTVTAQGNRTVGHWIARLDGKDYAEFSRAEGRTPTGTISLKKVDDSTVEINAKQPDGRVYFTGTWTMSEDGKTMIWRVKITNAQGRQTSQVRVYEKQ